MQRTSRRSARRRALGHIARRVSDAIPPTPAGVAVAAGSAVALFRFGLGRLDLILFVMGTLGLALAA